MTEDDNSESQSGLKIIHFLLILLGTAVFLFILKSIETPHTFNATVGGPMNPQEGFPRIIQLGKATGVYIAYIAVVFAHGLFLSKAKQA